MDPGTTFALIPLALVVYWSVGFLKDVTNKNWNGVITRLVALVGAFGAVVLYCHTRWASGFHIDSSTTLAGLGWAEQVLVALTFAAGGGTVSDTLRTLNRSDGSVAYTLIPGEVPDVPVDQAA